MCNIVNYIDTIYEDNEENTSLVKLNHPLPDNCEINIIDVDEIVTNEVSGKKRKTKTKKYNKVSREESKFKRIAGQEYMGYSRKMLAKIN